MVKQLQRVVFGYTKLPEDCIFEGGSQQPVPIVFSIFLVATENRKILVDAGCHTMPGFEMEHFIGSVAALKELGVSPEEITDLVLTHSHHDHAEAVACFKNAVVYVQEQERKAAQQYLLPQQQVMTFLDGLSLEPDIYIRTVGGHTPGSCVVELTFEGKKYALCGDACYTHYNLEHRVPTNTCTSKAQAQAFIDRYAGGDWICLLAHDNT